MPKPPSRPQPEPQDKPATHLRPLAISTDLKAHIDIKAIAKAAELTPTERDEFAKRVKEALQILKDSPDHGAAFQANPLAVLGKQFKDLTHLPPAVRVTLTPSTMDSACTDNQAASAALSSCARSLIIRVAQWSAMSPANRAVLESNPDAAVNAVSSWGFPAEAITLVKSAFQTSRHTP
jgi:hypothetical protein